jgi:hypothetical protein
VVGSTTKEPNMTSRRAALTLLLALPVAACDAQTDGGYKGEPLVTLTGTVEGTTPASVPAGVDLVLAYFVAPEDPYAEFCLFGAKVAFDSGQAPDLGCKFQHLAPERLEVVGQFPAAFQFALVHPPPAAAVTESQGVQIALANIFAVKKGSADDGELELGDLLGYSNEFVVWTGHDIDTTAGDFCRQAQDGTLSCGPAQVAAGFHLARALCAGQTVGPDTVCAALVDGQPITVELSDLATIVEASVSTWTAS